MKPSLAALLAVVVLAGCGSSRMATTSQGLVVQTPKAVLLVGLDGHVLRTLPGYHLSPGSSDLVLEEMTVGETAVPVLVGPRGRVFEVQAGELVPVPATTLPLPGGAEIRGRVVRRRSDGSPVVAVSVRDADSGKPLTHSPKWKWFITTGGLLATPKVVTDLVTRKQWRLRGAVWAQGVGTSFCTPAGVRAGRIVAMCAYKGAVRLFSVAPDGSRDILGKPFRYLPTFGAQSAFLSPDGKHVAATLAVGCGLTPSMIAPADGGAPRYIDGSAKAGPQAQSWLLGWTPGGKVVAEFQHGECVKASPPAIDLVDPVSFERTRIYVLPKGTTAYEMWSR